MKKKKERKKRSMIDLCWVYIYQLDAIAVIVIVLNIPNDTRFDESGKNPK